MPTLRPGDIVVMDNLGSHKSPAVRRAIRAAGARLFLLPKYSPDLNPIEMFFSKLKHRLRKTAARTQDALCDAIAHILDTVTPTECRNYLAEAGYDRTQTHPALANVAQVKDVPGRKTDRPTSPIRSGSPACSP